MIYLEKIKGESVNIWWLIIGLVFGAIIYDQGDFPADNVLTPICLGLGILLYIWDGIRDRDKIMTFIGVTTLMIALALVLIVPGFSPIMEVTTIAYAVFSIVTLIWILLHGGLKTIYAEQKWVTEGLKERGEARKGGTLFYTGVMTLAFALVWPVYWYFRVRRGHRFNY